GVKYEYVTTDWANVVPDVIGRKIKVTKGVPELLEEAPVKGDLIANGFTILPWREQVLNFGKPTFPNQIWLVARADSKTRPIKPTKNIEKDIAATRALMKGKTVLAMEKTCLDPGLYDLGATGASIQCKVGNLNEMAPAVIKGDAELTILDVPDALVALDKFKGKIKIIGPISDKQLMAVAFPKGSPKLLDAYNAFIDKMKKDGTYLKMVKKYYPTVPRYFPEFFKGLT
ncbi:MAG: transporter substrate-binding domain-containing protein, partial [Deltaproteobacteria bacterium]|nr:transporter substrate-binding domain-containing protein [Deltaproteobacteria bacterium]